MNVDVILNSIVDELNKSLENCKEVEEFKFSEISEYDFKCEALLVNGESVKYKIILKTEPSEIVNDVLVGLLNSIDESVYNLRSLSKELIKISSSFNVRWSLEYLDIPDDLEYYNFNESYLCEDLENELMRLSKEFNLCLEDSKIFKSINFTLCSENNSFNCVMALENNNMIIIKLEFWKNAESMLVNMILRIFSEAKNFVNDYDLIDEEMKRFSNNLDRDLVVNLLERIIEIYNR